MIFRSGKSKKHNILLCSSRESRSSNGFLLRDTPERINRGSGRIVRVPAVVMML